MTLRTILARELLYFGEGVSLADKLLGCKDSKSVIPLARWCIDQMQRRKYMTRVDIIREFDGGLSTRQVESAMYGRVAKNLQDIKNADPFAYENLREELYRLSFSQTLWDSLIPFAYMHVKELVIVSMLQRGMHPSDIGCALSVSDRKVYEVKKEYGIKSKTRNV